MQVAPDKAADRPFLPDPGTLTDCLLLADRGYPSVPYCEAVRARGGAFIMRLSRSRDPWVCAAWVEGTRLAGLRRVRLSRFLGQHAGQRVDLDIEYARGARRNAFRLVVIPGRDPAMTRLCTTRPGRRGGDRSRSSASPKAWTSVRNRDTRGTAPLGAVCGWRETTVATIELRCRAHNLYEAELAFGTSVRPRGHGRHETRTITADRH